jgi:thymidylate kinase
MNETKLILIEGLPGAGKSTTCEYLGKYFLEQEVPCNWYLETDKEHPLDFSSLKLKDLSKDLAPLWRAFVEQILRENILAVVESRFWQNSALFMYMSEYPVEEIVETHQLVWREFVDIAPALIYLYQTDVEKAMQRLYQERDRKIIEKDIELTSRYPWFQNRSLNDLGGWIEFFTAWQEVAEILYQDFPYQKIIIENPHEDWAQAYQQMMSFLKNKSSADSFNATLRDS